MRRAVIGCLLLATVAGCNRAEKQSLKQFLEILTASLGHRYDDELKGVPDPERGVRFRVLFGRDQLAATDTYLASNPPIAASARRAVDDFRAVLAAELELYERLIAGKRYELNDQERQRDAELRREAQRHLDAIGRMIDG